MQRTFISCDWGTSTLRLYLAELKNFKVLHQYQCEEGISKVYQKWQDDNIENREDFFRSYLRNGLFKMKADLGFSLNNLPIIASGMITSSIGLKELPYKKETFEITSPSLNTEILVSTPDFPHNMLLISGVCTDREIMRGEETQMIGAFSTLKITGAPVLMIIPGTHSKHIHIENEKIQRFKTFMTGEIFDLLTSKSSLQSTVKKNLFIDNEKLLPVFYDGLKEAQNGNLLSDIFQSRTSFLLHGTSKEMNYAYLSGILLGNELSNIPEYTDKIILVGNQRLNALYNLAIRFLFNINPQLMDVAECNIAGQVKIGRSIGFL